MSPPEADAVFQETTVGILVSSDKSITLCEYLQISLLGHKQGMDKFLANMKSFILVSEGKALKLSTPSQGGQPYFIACLSCLKVSQAIFFWSLSGTPLPSPGNMPYLCIVRDPVSMFFPSCHYTVHQIFSQVIKIIFHYHV